MRLAAALLACTLGMTAQQAAQNKPDPEFHADVLKLLDLEGVRGQMEASIPSSLVRGREVMMQKCGGCTPQFGDEWLKRMKVRLNPDDLMQVVVQVYEKDLTDTDVKQLIPIVKAKKDGQQVTIPDPFKQRISSLFPSIQSEIIGGCTQIGAKLGAEVAMQLEKEHPDWAHPPAK